MNTMTRLIARSFALLVLAVAVVAPELAVAAPPSSDEAEPKDEVRLVEYTVQPGDSCTKVAKKHFGDRNRYDLLHEHNPQLGPTPHKLKPGQILMLPVSDQDPDAEITATHRNVQARPKNSDSWEDATTGWDLYRGWRVNTLERSSAEVTFLDHSSLQMRENTLVIIFGKSAGNARRQTTEARLERGTLRGRLGELEGNTLEVEMPGGAALLANTDGLIGVDDVGTGRVANHGDGQATVTAQGKKVDVGPKMGSKVVRGKKPSKPKPLPPTPGWIAGSPQTFVGVYGYAGSVRGSWSAVDEAEQYLVQIARRADGGDVIAAITVPGNVTQFEAHGLPPGDYHAFVSSIDDDQFESPPSAGLPLHLVETELALPGGIDPVLPDLDAVDEDSAAPAPVVLPGTRVASPDGLQCFVGDREPAAEAVFTEPGRQTLSCVDGDGDPVPGFEVEVAEIDVGTGEDGVRWPLEIPRGESATHTVRLAADLELPENALEFSVEDGLSVQGVEAIEPGAWAVTIAASADAPERSVLTIALGGASVSELAVWTPARPRRRAEGPVDPDARELNLFELNIAGGVTFPSTAHPYGTRQDPDNHFLMAPTAGTFAARFGYYPIRYVGIELEPQFAVTSLRTAGSSVWILGLSGQVVGQLPYRVTPTLTVGGAMTVAVSDRDTLGVDHRGALLIGLGLKAYVTRRVALRLDARNLLMGGYPQGTASNWQVLAGVSFVFGRQTVGRRTKPPSRESISACAGVGEPRGGACG